jgi:transposase-like protein
MRKSNDEAMVVANVPQGLSVGDGENRVGRNGFEERTSDQVHKALIPDPQVDSRPQRRHFSAAYKARIVEEAERCTQLGEVGALLRREGLYSSNLSKWREQYRTGALDALRDDKRGRKARKHPLEDEIARLRKENARLSCRIERAEAIIDIQKKVAAMLGNPLTSVEPIAGD